METVIPMMGLADSFSFFVCSEDVGAEKPDQAIFERAYQEAQFWLGPLRKDEILHIGDSLAADFCGAKAFGFQALWLNRSGDARVDVFQDWLEAPKYPGKSEADIRQSTVTDLSQARALLERCRQPPSVLKPPRIRINLPPARREPVRYEVRSNRGRVMEQFDQAPVPSFRPPASPSQPPSAPSQPPRGISESEGLAF